MIKKILICALAAIILLSACACAKAPAPTGKLNIVTTIFPPYDFARQIVGDKANVTMLLSPDSEAHSYEPTVADLAAVQKCDIFVYIGSDSDKWVEKMLSSVGRDDIIAIKMTDCVELIDGDEHVWTSVRNAQDITRAICDAACEKDGANAELYRANSDAYCQKLINLDHEIITTVQSAAKNTLVFSERFPFAYFTDDYGLEHFSSFDGCSVDNDVSLAKITELISHMNKLNLKVVLYTEFSTEKIADRLCEGTGAKKALFHSCHNVSSEDFANGVTYLDLMRQNAEVLKEALN